MRHIFQITFMPEQTGIESKLPFLPICFFSLSLYPYAQNSPASHTHVSRMHLLQFVTKSDFSSPTSTNLFQFVQSPVFKLSEIWYLISLLQFREHSLTNSEVVVEQQEKTFCQYDHNFSPQCSFSSLIHAKAM